MKIRAGDRVAAVIARDEHLIEVFTALSPTFERLRNPAMRKVMARLVTVEQAARMAGVEVEVLLARLNEALSAGEGIVEPQRREEREGEREESAMELDTNIDVPPMLAGVDPERIVDIDVRPDLRRGEEPFSKIMAARREVPEGGVLRLRATFEPVPLYAVLGKQGFAHWTERFADDDWRVWFYQEGGAAGEGAIPPRAAPGTPSAPGGEDDVVILDVRGLEPPEPMMRTLAALEQLPEGKTLVQLNVRVPQFLLPQLEARGFSYEVREQSPELVRLFIRRQAAR